MTDIIGSSPIRILIWLTLDLCLLLEYCFAFFLDLKPEKISDTPRNDEVFVEEGGKTVGNTAAGPGASAVNVLMRP
jgi:hypothetical protein